MAIDIRATVTCSLGTLISGSISDDYIQGSGLVKTKGSVEISATITPAIGTVVTFSYVKGGVTRSIPRKLRVMSSFADPFRRTTKVELGCKLTYLSDLREALTWDAFDDPQNAAYDADDARIVTLPIRASSVMTQCLTELGITASSSPLTNKFSITEFDFGAGYVQVLNDLLVSESYCGYLDTSEVLQVFSLDQDAGTGPVFTASDIVDLGPIAVGQLPGEAVTVSYSTLKLKQPEDTADADFNDNNATRLWERSFTVAGPNTYYVGAKVFTGLESTETLTTYSRIGDSDVPTKRVTTETGSSAKIAGTIGSAYQTNGIGFNAITTTLRREEELITYDREGNRIRTDVTQYEQALAIFGGVSLNYVFSATDYVSFSYVLLPSARTVSTYDISGDLQQETSSSYVLWPQTIPGQQAVAEYRDSLATSGAVSNYVNAIASAGLVHERTTVTINTANTEPGRPIDIISASYANGGDPNNGWRTESTADLELAVGSATAQRRIELSMPYAPDDTFSGASGGPFTATASDASAKANRYGRVQNRLLLGNRNGINLQLAPERLPAAPYSPLYVQANGLTALYRANGTSWAFDSNGIVCSVDALFWAAVGGTGTFWFPVAPGITTLPTTPAITDGTMNPANTVLPYNETAVYEGRLRLGNIVTKFEYSLSLLTVLPSLVIKTPANSYKVTPIYMPAPVSITIGAPIPRIQTSTAVRVTTSPTVTLATPSPIFAVGSAVSLLLHMDGTNGSTTFTDSSLNALSITAYNDAKISTAQSKFGGASALFDGNTDSLEFPEITLSNDFTVECWVYPASTGDMVVLSGSTLNTQVLRFNYSSTGTILVYVDAFIIEAPSAITTNQWQHVALTRVGSNTRLFVDGVQKGPTNTTWTTPLYLQTIGRLKVSGSYITTYDYNGYIDELRVISGAGYVTNFTPPTAAFPNP
jgi:hypothetical protein